MTRNKFSSNGIRDYMDLLRKIAWSFHRTTGVEFEELFSEACLAYLEGITKYRPHKGAVSTFMYRHIRFHLILCLKKYPKFVYFDDPDIMEKVQDSFNYLYKINNTTVVQNY